MTKKTKKLLTLKKKISGPVFSIVTPFKDNRIIDYNSYYSYLDFYYSQGVRIFYIMLYNSRLGIMTEDEVKKFNIRTAKYLKSKYKDVILIGAEKFEGSSEETVNRINKVYKSGIDVFSVILGEKYYSDDQVFSHFKYINKKSKLPLLLHLQKMMNGYGGNPPVLNYSLGLTNKILGLNKFIAVKDDAKENKFTKKLIETTTKEVAIIKAGGGMVEWFKRYKKIGCESWLVGIELLDPKIAFDFMTAIKNNDKKFINNLKKKLEDPFFKEVKKYGWHLFIKSCLDDCGIMSRNERFPLKELSNKDHQKIKKFMQKLRYQSRKYFKKDYFIKRNIK